MKLTKEEMVKDRDKLVKELQQTQIHAVRLEGAIAYLNGNLQESANDSKEPDTKK